MADAPEALAREDGAAPRGDEQCPEPGGTAPAPGSLGRRIAMGGLAVAAATLLFKLMSLFWRQALGATFTMGEFTDVHMFAVNGIALALLDLIAQVVAPAFLPVFVRARERSGEREAMRFAWAVAVLVVAFSGAAALYAFAFPGSFGALSAWLSGRELDAHKAAMLSGQIRWVAPSIVLLGASVVTFLLLTARKRFFWAQSGETAMRAMMIAAVVGAGAAAVAGTGAVAATGLGVVAGAAARLVVHALALGRKGLALARPRFSSEAMRSFLILAAPLLAGAAVSKLRDFTNHNAALVFVGEGVLTANNFGRATASLMEWLVPASLAVATFPYFCELADRNDLDGLGRILTRSGRVLGVFFAAFSGAVAALSMPVACLIFGAFGKASAGHLRLVAVANACYVVVLPALSVEKLLMQGFYSNRRTVTPTVIGVAFSVLSMCVSIVGIRWMRCEGAGAIAVVALGYTASRWMKTVVLAAVLRRRVPVFPAGETARFAVKALATAAASAGAAFAVHLAWQRALPIEAALEGRRRLVALLSAGEVAAGGTAAIAAGLLVMWLLGADELRWAAEWLRGRRRRRPPAPRPPP